MHVGDILLWAAFAVGILAMVLTLVKLFVRLELDTKITWTLSVLTFLLVSIPFFLLVNGFLSSDMTLEYVHSYSATDHEWFYKVTGVWAGGKGSIFLWAFFLSLFAFIQVSVWNLRSEKKRSSEEYQDWLFLILTAFIMVLVFIVLKLDMFASTPAFRLAADPGGIGLNPLLETPLMTIHPPVEFAAYGVAAVPFAASIAYLASNDKRWKFDALTYGRMSWLFMSLGIVIGALWAYTVLGWGGYWGWDPVETANLLPWISLTAFLHAAFMHRRKGSYANMAPLLGILSFALVLFTTFETRSGYVDSVHAFAGGGASLPFDPADKLIAVLEASQESAFFLAILLFILLIGALFFMRRFLRQERGSTEWRYVGYAYMLIYGALLIPIAIDVTTFLSVFFDFARALGLGNLVAGLAVALLLLIGIPFIWVVMTSEAKEESEKRPILHSDSWMMLTILILAVWFLATFLLMMQGLNGLNPKSFEDRLPLILVPLGAILILCLSWGYVSPGFSFYIVGLIVVTSVIGFVIFANRYFFVYIPICLGILATAGYRIMRVSAKKDTSRNLQLAGLFLISASILGMVMWGSGPTRVWLGPASFETSLPLLFLGLVASVVPFVAGIGTLRAGSFRLALFGGILGLASIGFLAGTILSAIALVLIVSERESFSRSTSLTKSVKRPLMTASAHLIHIGAALIIIGYATSTFLPESYENEILLTNQSYDYEEGYTLEVIESRGFDIDSDLLYEIMEVVIRISDSSETIAEVPLRMVWAEPGLGGLARQYMSEVHVHSEHAVDIYFILIGFFTVADEWKNINTEYETTEKFASPDITAVRVGVKFIPLVGLVWSGTWIMSAGIVARVTTDRWPEKRKDVPRAPVVEADKDYEKILEAELGALEGG
jgi:cytochrome c-type biogenesis protein CcmF